MKGRLWTPRQRAGGVVHVSVPGVQFSARCEGGSVSDREPSRGQKACDAVVVSSGTNDAGPRHNARPGSLVSVAAFAYAGVMYAAAVVGGKVVRFKLSPALARAHRENRGKAMTEAEAVVFVALCPVVILLVTVLGLTLHYPR